MANAGVISEEKDPYITQEAEYAQLLDLLKNKPAAPAKAKGAATLCCASREALSMLTGTDGAHPVA